MKLLTDVPPEVLLTILDNLSHQKDVNSFIQSSKRLYHQYRPYLVRHNVLYHRSSALAWAAKHGQTDLINVLQLAGANIALYEPERPWDMDDPAVEKIENPLLSAVRGNHLEAFKALLAQPPPPTLLHIAFHCAIRWRRTEFVDLMLHPHAPLGRRNTRHQVASSALCAAVRSQSLAMVKRLIEYGAKTDPKDVPDAVSEALCSNANLEILELLLSRGESLGADWALRAAAVCNDKAPLKILVKHGLNLAVYGHYALFHAVMKGHVEMAEFLIDHGANPHLCTSYMNEEDDRLHSSIWYAVHERHLAMLKFLIAKGVRPDREDVQLAETMGFHDAVAILHALPYENPSERVEIAGFVAVAERDARRQNPAFKKMYSFVMFMPFDPSESREGDLPLLEAPEPAPCEETRERS
ncbi:ankyrin repeat-containing domain protein [Aspergillus multicolor]|uniref:ankyrin repeat-containing domain protein n=1 Tax=Aspergillus multicolor TaxID=41759 RepID=UPI003CCDB52A